MPDINLKHKTATVLPGDVITSALWNDVHSVTGNVDLGSYNLTANMLIANHATTPSIYFNQTGVTKSSIYWASPNLVINPTTAFDIALVLASGKGIIPSTDNQGNIGSAGNEFYAGYFSQFVKVSNVTIGQNDITMPGGGTVDGVDVSSHAHTGGQGGQITHNTLAGLGSDDHGLYLRTDGARNATGDITVLKADAQVIVRSGTGYRWSMRIDGANDEELQFYDLFNGFKRQSMIYNAVTSATNMSWFNCDGFLKGYMTYAGNFYADGTWLTFSPDIPDELDELKTRIQSEIGKEKIKRLNGEALCVCGKLLKDCKEHGKEVHETHAKDIGFLAAANSKLLINLLERVEELEKKIQ